MAQRQPFQKMECQKSTRNDVNSAGLAQWIELRIYPAYLQPNVPDLTTLATA